MKLNLKTHFILIVVLVLPISLGAQNTQIKIPKAADISINGIYLSDPKSSREVLGNEIVLTGPAHNPHTIYYNKDCTQSLILFLHPGDYRDSFNEIHLVGRP